MATNEKSIMSRENQPEEQQDRTITDPEELTQAQRIQGLLNRRDRLIDALETMTISKVESDTEHSNAQLLLVAELQSLVLDLYPLLIENNKTVLMSEQIGEFNVEPPESAPTDSLSPRLNPGASPAESVGFNVEGLQWFINHEFPIEVTWKIDCTGGIEEFTKEVLPPFNVCIDAAIVVIQQMKEMKIDAQLEQESGTHGFDYDEISDIND